MMRVVRWQVIGACLLLGLAGCARMWFAEREPWRGEAETSCLKSGAVKEGPSIAIIKAIEGPGACGADYPLRVAALGDSAVLSFADEPARLSGTIQAASAAPPPATATGIPLSFASSLRSEPPDSHTRQQVPIRAPAVQVLGRPANAATAARPAAVSPAATLACPLVSTLDRFVSDSVQPAATRWFGQPVAEIRQISAYSCRGMNGETNARISEHAFGNALDIAAFTLADGRTITVRDGWHGAPEEQGFLHEVQSAACAVFTTVLAPGSNTYHSDHMHVDLMRRSGGQVICEPAAISGDAAFARAGGHFGPARVGETPYKRSLALTRSPPPTTRLPTDQRDARGRELPSTVAGRD